MATTTKKTSSRGKAKGTSNKGSGKSERCWNGYEPVPGKKPYSKGSCRKKS